MGDTSGTTRAPIGAILAIVGGALLAVGSFLSWADLKATLFGTSSSATAKGLDGSDGYITLVAGLVALVSGVVMSKRPQRLLAILTVLAGLIGAGVGAYDAATANDSFVEGVAEDIAAQVGGTTEEVRAELDQAAEAGDFDFSVSIGIGLYVVIGGGVLAFIGGLLSVRGGRETTAAPAGFSSGPPVAAGEPPAMPSTPPSEAPAPPGGEPSG